MKQARGWRARQLRVALATTLRWRVRRLGAVTLAVAVMSASFAFASVRIFSGDALAATPTMTTVTSPDTEVGGDFLDSATLRGGDNPTGTITFRLYAPGDTGCTTSIFDSEVTVSGNASYNSAQFTATEPGTYQYVAFYSGDPNNDPVSGLCGDATEQVLVTKARTTITTTASPSVPIGGQIFDTAHLLTGVNPTGSLTFDLYGPTDQFCNLAPVFTSTVTVNGSGNYVSETFSPLLSGNYKWKARYSGDDNNLGSGPGNCLDPAENVSVTGGLITPTVTTTASGSVTVGGQVHDTAVLAGGIEPTGTITFALFGPNDATCGGSSQSASVPVVGNSQYVSPDFTVSQPGIYRFVATYSGDVAHESARNACDDPAEAVVVTSDPGSTTTSSPTSTTTTSTTTPTSSTSPSSSSSSSSSTTPSSTSSTTPSSTSSTSPSSTSSTTASSTSSTSPSSTSPSSTSPSSTSSTSSTSTSTTVLGPSTGTTSPTTSTTASTTPTTVAGGSPTTQTSMSPTVGVTPSTATAGQDVTVFGSGFPGQRPLDVLLFSSPVLLGRVVTDASGRFRVTLNVPADTPPGSHRLVAAVPGGVQAETTLVVTGPVGTVTTTRSGPLARTGDDLADIVRFAVGLLVAGLLVGGVLLPEVRRRPFME